MEDKVFDLGQALCPSCKRWTTVEVELGKGTCRDCTKVGLVYFIGKRRHIDWTCKGVDNG